MIENSSSIFAIGTMVLMMASSPYCSCNTNIPTVSQHIYDEQTLVPKLNGLKSDIGSNNINYYNTLSQFKEGDFMLERAKCKNKVKVNILSKRRAVCNIDDLGIREENCNEVINVKPRNRMKVKAKVTSVTRRKSMMI